MKEGLIKITGEDNLYYDSITKQYKYAMHCPQCGRYSGCWCYPDFESTPIWDNECPDVYCSDRCFVFALREDLAEIASEMGITIHSKMEEWNASKIVYVFMEDLDIGDVDISGSSCET